MRKLIAICLIGVFLLNFVGCGETEEQPLTLSDMYIKTAQDFVNNGDLASAIAALEEGYAATNDQALADMLAKLKAEQTTAATTTGNIVSTTPSNSTGENSRQTTTQATTTETTTTPTTASPTTTTTATTPESTVTTTEVIPVENSLAEVFEYAESYTWISEEWGYTTNFISSISFSVKEEQGLNILHGMFFYDYPRNGDSIGFSFIYILPDNLGDSIQIPFFETYQEPGYAYYNDFGGAGILEITHLGDLYLKCRIISLPWGWNQMTDDGIFTLCPHEDQGGII